MALLGDIVDQVVKGAIEKALQGFVAKGELTQAQAGTLTAGIELEIMLALEIYESGQKTPPAAS
jgi:hypothetical protein